MLSFIDDNSNTMALESTWIKGRSEAALVLAPSALSEERHARAATAGRDILTSGGINQTNITHHSSTVATVLDDRSHDAVVSSDIIA